MKYSITLAKIYDTILEPVLKSLKQRMVSMAKKHNAFPIIDLCCGTGKQVHYFSRFGKTAGLDIEESMVAFAAEKYPNTPFILADATNIPIKSQSFKAVSVSLAFHDKSPEMRKNILKDAKNLVGANGFFLLLDFENPWNTKSKLGYILVYIIELMAGWEHFQNGRQFLRAGGLEQFIRENGLIEIDRYNSQTSCSSIVLVQQAS